ncbi:MAG: hypothetical protein ACQEQL_05060 [Pseudomonadota bacterium]
MKIKHFKKAEKGNALFLILIAVALFAALSYAVTQSGRGGGGVDREQALIAASQITQYGAGLRTTLTRMVITGSGATDIVFDGTGDEADQVFHVNGGGAVDQAPPANAGTATTYTYMPTDGTNGFHVTGVGSDDAGDGQDILVGVDGLSLAVCRAINTGLGLDAAPTEETTAVVMGTPGTTAAGDNAHSFNSNSGEAFACVDNTGNDYTYYHALVER